MSNTLDILLNGELMEGAWTMAGFLTTEDLCRDILKMSVVTFYKRATRERLAKLGLPAPIGRGPATRWNSLAIEAWLKRQAEGTDPGAPAAAANDDGTGPGGGDGGDLTGAAPQER